MVENTVHFSPRDRADALSERPSQRFHAVSHAKEMYASYLKPRKKVSSLSKSKCESDCLTKLGLERTGIIFNPLAGNYGATKDCSIAVPSWPLPCISLFLHK